MTTIAPYNWLRRVPEDFKKLSETPLFGSLPNFDLAAFSAALSTALNLEDVQIKTTPLLYKEFHDVHAGFENSEELFFQVSPYEGLVTLLIPRQNLDSLIHSFADADLHYAIVDEDFKNSFTHFIALELLSAFQSSFTDQKIVPQYLESGTLNEEPFWCQDIELSWKGGLTVARLIFPDALRLSWKSKFSEQKLILPKELLSSIHVEIHVEVGSVVLSHQEWDVLSLGDYLVLDRCQIVPGEEKGRVLLTLNGSPVFRAKIKGNSIKILETPEFTDLLSPISKSPSTGKTMQDDNDETFEETEEFIEEDESEESEEEETPEETDVEETNSGLTHKPFKTEDIPLNIIVEVGRFNMTVQKLSELQPGNVVDLDINPDNGVDLVINGIAVAKGELLKVGDTLGVRILDIAK